MRNGCRPPNAETFNLLVQCIMPHAHQGSVDVVVDSMNRDEALFECIAYKATRLSEIVCQRTVTLFKDRFTTTHQDLSGGKCWYLDRSCRLEPEYVEEIISPERRSIRPPGTWTVTAKLGTVTGSGQPIELVCDLACASGVSGQSRMRAQCIDSSPISHAFLSEALQNMKLTRMPWPA